MLSEVKPVAMLQIEAARVRLEGLSTVPPIVSCDAAPARHPRHRRPARERASLEGGI
jgi:hypothetical protein